MSLLLCFLNMEGEGEDESVRGKKRREKKTSEKKANAAEGEKGGNQMEARAAGVKRKKEREKL